MTHHELSDIRKTNDRCQRKRTRLAQYRQRTAKRRDERQLLSLLGSGIVQRWRR